MNKNHLEIFLKVVSLIIEQLNSNIKYNPKYANTIHFLSGKDVRNELLKAKFPMSHCIITGNPMFDEPISKIKNFKTTKNLKTKVLLISNALPEHGIWTKNQRNELIKKTLVEIKKYRNNIELIIKIHPTSENLEEWIELVGNTDKNIKILQNEEILDLIEQNDVIICFTSDTSASILALLARKPIIIYNFYNTKGDRFVEKNLALLCKNSSNLYDSIKNVLESNPASEKKIMEFIEDHLFKEDGNAGKRITESLLTLLKNQTR